MSGNGRYGTFVNYLSTDLYPSCWGRGACDTSNGPSCICLSSSYPGLACEQYIPCTSGTCLGTCNTQPDGDYICIGPPTVPRNFANGTVTSSAIPLSWIHPLASSSTISSYTVTVQPSGGSVSTAYNGTSVSTTITGLSSETTYTFTIYATNSYGNSATESVTATTLPGPPGSPTLTSTVSFVVIIVIITTIIYPYLQLNKFTLKWK
jgi:hypothetical protein